MFSTEFIFKQQENLVDNQKCQAEFRPLCNKILFLVDKILSNKDKGIKIPCLVPDYLVHVTQLKQIDSCYLRLLQLGNLAKIILSRNFMRS